MCMASPPGLSRRQGRWVCLPPRAGGFPPTVPAPPAGTPGAGERLVGRPHLFAPSQFSLCLGSCCEHVGPFLCLPALLALSLGLPPTSRGPGCGHAVSTLSSADTQATPARQQLAEVILAGFPAPGIPATLRASLLRHRAPHFQLPALLPSDSPTFSSALLLRLRFPRILPSLSEPYPLAALPAPGEDEGFSKTFFPLNSPANGARDCRAQPSAASGSHVSEGLKDNNPGLRCLWPQSLDLCHLPADPSPASRPPLPPPSCCGTAAGTCLAARGAPAWPPGPLGSAISAASAAEPAPPARTTLSHGGPCGAPALMGTHSRKALSGETLVPSRRPLVLKGPRVNSLCQRVPAPGVGRG